MTQAGPAIPVLVSTAAPDAGPALRVAFVSDGRPIEAGPARPVVVVSDGRPTQGNEPVPVVMASGAQASRPLAGPPIPVAIASGFLYSFYVDATGGNDSNAGTSPATAWKNISKVNSFNYPPASQVLFKRGETWTGTILQAQSSVRYADYGSGAKPILDASGVANPIMAANKNNITLQNLDCRNGTTGAFFNACTNITVIDCDMSAGGNDCLAFQGGANITILRGTYSSAAAGGGHAGIEITDGCTDVLIDGVTCTGNPVGLTIHNHATPTAMPTRIVVRNVTVTSATLNAIQVSYDATVDGTATILLEDCTVQAASNHAFSLGNINTGFLSGSITLRRCVAHDAASGFYNFTVGVDDVTLERCISYRGAITTNRGMRVLGALRTKIYNCSLYLVANAGFAPLLIDGARTDNLDIRNCIVGSGDTGVRPVEITAAVSRATKTITLDYMLYQQSAALARWTDAGTSKLFATWKTDTGYDAHSIAGSDPLFVSTATPDFHLQTGSPAINAGVAIAGVTDGYQGSAPDLGAYEKA